MFVHLFIYRHGIASTSGCCRNAAVSSVYRCEPCPELFGVYSGVKCWITWQFCFWVFEEHPLFSPATAEFLTLAPGIPQCCFPFGHAQGVQTWFSL